MIMNDEKCCKPAAVKMGCVSKRSPQQTGLLAPVKLFMNSLTNMERWISQY